MLLILEDMEIKLQELLGQKKQNGESFDKIVLYFTATWCGPCKLIAPVVEELSNGEDYRDSILFVKIDVDECEQLMNECEVSCMPTFIFYSGNQKVDTLEGCDENQLRMKVAM